MAQTYKAPGVTIKEVANPSNIAVPGGYNVTAIIGNGSSTIDFENIAIVKAAGDVDAIPDRETDEVASITGIGDYPGFYNYVKDVDFQLTNGYQITWLTAHRPADGATFYITYKKNKVAADYNAIRFFDIDDVRKQYGNELDNGNINSLTLAAMFELEARGEGGGIICVQAEDGATASFIDAIDKLENEEVDTIICTGVTNSQVRSYLIEHLNLCSSDAVGKERTTFISATSLTESVNDQATLADALDNDRVCFIAPPAIGVTIKDATTKESTRIVVPSLYAGANISGIESNPDNDPATPMLRKKLSSKIDLNNFFYLKKEKNFLASKSCFVLEQNPVTAEVSVFDALTTDNSSADTQERSVRRIKDRIRKDVRAALDARYVGQKNANGMESNVQMSTQSLLSNFVDADIIREARNIKATRNPLDDRQIDVSFEILPVYPLKWISITFSVGI